MERESGNTPLEQQQYVVIIIEGRKGGMGRKEREVKVGKEV